MAELSVRYAASLFDLSVANGVLGDYLKQAVWVRDALQKDECRNIMEHPRLADDEKRQFLDGVFAGNIHDDLMGFLYMLSAEGRGDIIVPTLTAFINMGNLYTGKTVATVVSAFELSESQTQTLKKLLTEKLGKQVDIDSQVDTSVIGGFRINVDGCLIDHTVKKQLGDLVDSVKRGLPNDH